MPATRVRVGKSVTARFVAQPARTPLAAEVGDLLAFYSGEQDIGAVLASVTTGLNELAWHRANVVKHNQPELDL